MARKDDILKSFLEHDLLRSKYQIKEEDIPGTVSEAVASDIALIKSIGLIVQALEIPNPVTDSALRNIVTQYLNSKAI